MKSSVAAWLSTGLVFFHLIGAVALATVMWEQSSRDASIVKGADNYLRLLAKDWCRTNPSTTRR